MRQIHKTITVSLTHDPEWGVRPAAFRWAGQTVRVARVLDSWQEVGRYWELEPEATIWRVADHAGGVYEIAEKHTQPPEYMLLVVFD